MGGDIAAWSAFRGMTVTLQDRSEELIQPALGSCQGLFRPALKDPAAAAAAFARLRMDVKGDGVADSDVVIEAIFEECRRQTCPLRGTRAQAQAGRHSRHQYLEHQDRDLVREASDPGRLVGIHFFNPWRNCNWWKSCRARTRTPHVVQKALKFTRKLDKLPLPCKSAPGFVVNRILTPYVNEALFALEGGIPAAVIRPCRQGIRHAHGPIELTGRGGPGRLAARRPGSRRGVQTAGARHIGQTGGAEKTRPQSGQGFLPVAGRQTGHS